MFELPPPTVDRYVHNKTHRDVRIIKVISTQLNTPWFARTCHGSAPRGKVAPPSDSSQEPEPGWNVFKAENLGAFLKQNCGAEMPQRKKNTPSHPKKKGGVIKKFAKKKKNVGGLGCFGDCRNICLLQNFPSQCRIKKHNLLHKNRKSDSSYEITCKNVIQRK